MSVGESISSKWKCGNGYKATTKKGKVEDPDIIAGKWGNGNGYVKPNKEDERKKLSSTISDKFKKPE